ncbi:hypothetical protein FOS04_29575 [Bacillus cereus]|uniref:hypothetical protein n=2 Tax=Bacillus cereus TaxID=1396 RepID=UPI000314B752|nr:hypothetical protein [Bacillus cereus]MDR4293908.1 hypothetical protein [Bacillus cereus]
MLVDTIYRMTTSYKGGGSVGPFGGPVPSPPDSSAVTYYNHYDRNFTLRNPIDLPLYAVAQKMHAFSSSTHLETTDITQYKEPDIGYHNLTETNLTTSFTSYPDYTVKHVIGLPSKDQKLTLPIDGSNISLLDFISIPTGSGYIFATPIAIFHRKPQIAPYTNLGNYTYKHTVPSDGLGFTISPLQFYKLESYHADKAYIRELLANHGDGVVFPESINTDTTYKYVIYNPTSTDRQYRIYLKLATPNGAATFKLIFNDNSTVSYHVDTRNLNDGIDEKNALFYEKHYNTITIKAGQSYILGLRHQGPAAILGSIMLTPTNVTPIY